MELTYRIDCRELTSRAAAHDCFARVFALPAFFGADAVFYAEPISDVLGPLASVAVYCVCIRGVLARRAALAPQKLPN